MMRNLIGFNLIMFFFGFIAVYAAMQSTASARNAENLLRQARVDYQYMQQSVRILDSVEYQSVIEKLNSNSDELKISIAEVVANASSEIGLTDINYQLDGQDERLLPLSSFPIQGYRLDVTLKSENAKGLSLYLEAIKNAVAPWPTEVQACEIHRMIEKRLKVRCLVDIYYWGIYE